MEITKEDIVERLKLERSILADGGYGRSVRTAWRPTEYFRDSITCLNAGESEKVHPCTDQGPVKVRDLPSRSGY